MVIKSEHPAFGPYNLLSKGKSKSKAPEGFSKAQEGPGKSKAPPVRVRLRRVLVSPEDPSKSGAPEGPSKSRAPEGPQQE